MGGSVAQLAEVAGGAHDAPSEVVKPEAIDHHPGRQGVAGIGNGFGQFQSAASLLEGWGVSFRQDLQEAPRGQLSQVVLAAADVNFQVGRLFRVPDGVEEGVLGRQAFLQDSDLLEDPIHVVPALALQEGDHLLFHSGILVHFAVVVDAQRRAIGQVGSGGGEVEGVPEAGLVGFHHLGRLSLGSAPVPAIQLLAFPCYRDHPGLKRLRPIPKVLLGCLELLGPVVQIGMLLGPGLQVFDPALQGLAVQTGLPGGVGHRQPGFTQHLAGSPQVPGRLVGQDVSQLQGLALQKLLEVGFQVADALGLLLILGDHRLGSQGELVGLGALKDALQGVEVAGGDGVVLVVVTLGAGHRQPQKGPGGYIHPIVR